MEDRVPTKPNRVLIRPEDGSQSFYATMTRADEPTQVGDPLNKNTFLTDETARFAGLDPKGATPDKMFKTLAPHIGEIKTTVLDTLGENWLLCNGDAISALDYPELFSLMPEQGPVYFTNRYSTPNLDRLVEVNGRYAAIDYNSSAIYTTDDPIKEWVGVSPTADTTASFRDFIYADGKWVVLTATSIIISDNSDIFGSWSVYEIPDVSDARRFAYADGVWVVVSANGLGLNVHATRDLAGNWSSHNFISGANWGTSYFNVGSVVHHEGLWVCSATYHLSRAGSTDTGESLFTAVDPFVGWTRAKHTRISTTKHAANANSVQHINGVWVWAIYNPDNSGFVRVYSAKTVDALDVNTYFELFAGGQNVAKIQFLYHDSKWWFCTNSTLSCSDALDGTWSKYYNARGNSCVGVTQGLVIVGDLSVVFAETAKLLPVITPDKSYAYIRAE